METVYLGIGSNVGQKTENCYYAIKLLGERGLRLLAQSSLYETKPWGVENQPDFVNMCICVETVLSSYELLKTVQEVEKEVGRVKTFKWGPRVIDIDILLYGDHIINTEDLIVPHPFMLQRDFVLKPLREIAPNILKTLGL